MRSKPTYGRVFCPVSCVKLVPLLALCMHLANIVTVLLPPGYPALLLTVSSLLPDMCYVLCALSSHTLSIHTLSSHVLRKLSLVGVL
jgi:hypothetical protein